MPEHDRGVKTLSTLRRQRLDVLRRARRLPVGADRNDLRQLAVGLRYLEQKGMAANVQHPGSLLEALQRQDAASVSPPSSLA